MAQFASLSLLIPLLSIASWTALHGNTAPVLDPLLPAPPAVPVVKPEIACGKVLLFPVTALDADGDPLTYKVKSSNPKIFARVKTGNPFLKLAVSYAGDGETAPPFSGDLFFQLFRDWSPTTAEFLGGFAQAGFYDGKIFHRIADLMKDNDPGTTETSFIVQGGDPAGNGSGGPPFRYENEFHPGAIFTGRGQLALANSGYRTNATFENNQLVQGDWTATNGSQFFITDGQPRFLDFKHTIAGQLTRGWEVFDKMVDVPRHPASADPTKPEDKPRVPLTITAASIAANNHDAVLVLSAAGVGSATITVTVEDGKGGRAESSFRVTAVDDEWNTRAFLVPPGNAVAPKEQPFRVGATAIDLEQDYLFRNPQLVGGSDANATLNSQGVIRGKTGFTGPIRVGFTVTEFDMTYRGTIDGAGAEVADRTTLVVGIGDKSLEGEAINVAASSTLPLSNALVARFQDADTRGVAGDWTAKINWGDGTAVSAGVIARDTARPALSGFVVSGGHTYARPGIYPVVTEIAGLKGARALVRSQAVVLDGTANPEMSATRLLAKGEVIDARVPALVDFVVATFTDPASVGNVRSYAADIDWGDGAVTQGRIKAGREGFSVLGSHRYIDAETFSVRVDIRKPGTSAAATAWSTATLRFNSPQHLPPFPQAHLVSAWETDPVRTLKGQGSSAQARFEGSLLIVNSGNKKSPPSELRFWLSKDKTLNKKGIDADLPMKIGTFPQAFVASLDAGAGVRYEFKKEGGRDLRLVAPKGETGAAFNILAELDYKDPIIDHSAVDKVGLFGPINAIIVEPATGLMTNEGGSMASFAVRLEKAPTANVSIAIRSSDLTEGMIEIPVVSTDPADPANTRKLVFTPENFSLPQTVTVKGVEDALHDGDINYSVIFAPGVSTDIRYSGMTATPATVRNLDNESGIKVIAGASLTTTEAGGEAQFTVQLERRPNANVVIPIDSSDVTEGTVAPASLSFSVADWNVPKIVKIKGVDDADLDGNVGYMVRLNAATSSDTSFQGKDAPDLSVTNTDNEVAP